MSKTTKKRRLRRLSHVRRKEGGYLMLDEKKEAISWIV